MSGGLTVRRARIAGRVLEVRAPFDPFARPGWAPFLTQDPPGLTLEVEAEGAPHRGPRSMPRSSREEGGALRLLGEDFTAVLEADGRRAHLRGAPGAYPVEAVLKVLLARDLLGEGGLLLHSVGLEVNGAGFVFVGESGAGKSTLAELAEADGLTVLADELVAVVREGRGYVLHGTPWNRGAPAFAPCRGVGTLSFREDHVLEDRPAAEVARVLLGNALLPEDSPEGRAALLRAASAFLEAVRPCRLGFARAAGVAKALGGP